MIQITNKNIDKIAFRHYINLLKQLIKDKKFQSINNWFMSNGSKITFKEAILSSIENLDVIKNKYANASYPPEIIYLVDIYEKKFAKARSYLGTKGYNSAKLVDILGIKVCPYCNRNFINSTTKKNHIRKSNCQIDHYYNKKIYPFLALSFYNLVPSCSSCNHTKHKDDISLSPYNKLNDFNDQIKFSYRIKSANYLNDEKKVEVAIKCKKTARQNVDILGLRGLYKIHNDVAFEIIHKCNIYTEEKLDELYKDFSGLYKTKDEMTRVLFGNYLEEKDIGKRPLAKLCYDIYNEIRQK